MSDLLLTQGALLKCNKGLTPAPLNVLPLNRTFAGSLPAANMADQKPFLNIMPFGMCTTMTNPAVALAFSTTGVKLAPCIPVLPAPWMKTSLKVKVGPLPAVTKKSCVMCMWAGKIEALMTSQFKAKAS